MCQPRMANSYSVNNDLLSPLKYQGVKRRYCGHDFFELEGSFGMIIIPSLLPLISDEIPNKWDEVSAWDTETKVLVFSSAIISS